MPTNRLFSRRHNNAHGNHTNPTARRISVAQVGERYAHEGGSLLPDTYRSTDLVEWQFIYCEDNPNEVVAIGCNTKKVERRVVEYLALELPRVTITIFGRARVDIVKRSLIEYQLMLLDTFLLQSQTVTDQQLAKLTKEIRNIFRMGKNTATEFLHEFRNPVFS
jgi:hypothetical protein